MSQCSRVDGRQLCKRVVKTALRIVLRASEPLLAIFFPAVEFNSRWFRKSYAGYLWCFCSIWQRNILRLAPPMPWPCRLSCIVSNPDNISLHPDDLNNFQSPGTYFQCFKGKIFLGKGVYIAPNVGIITVNHDPRDLDCHLEARDVVIGDSCWIGMNAVVLPGVALADKTIVGAGAVVTKSSLVPGLTLVGVPAKPMPRDSNSSSKSTTNN
jgi:hypothetical protein